MLFLPAYVVCIVEPPAGERPRSVAHGSVRNELVGRLCMTQLVRDTTENIKTNWAPVASRINFNGGNYFRQLFKRRLFSINSIAHKLIQPVIYLTQNSMSLYFSNKYSTDKIQSRMKAGSLPYLVTPNNINSTVCLFAANYVLYREINNQSDPQELQKDIDELRC